MLAALSLVPMISLIPPGLPPPEVPAPENETARAEAPQAARDSVRGRTIRWTWSEGPVAGVTHEHEFRRDGTVKWRVLSGPQKGHEAVEDEYEVFGVSETVAMVSYRAASGHTLTVTLNFETGEMFGFASGRGQWHPGRGIFEVVG